MKFDNELIIKLIKTAIYIVIGIVIYNIIAYLVKKIAFKDKVTDESSKRKRTFYTLLLNIIKYIIMIFTIMFILQMYGINVSALLAGVGIVGAIIGLAVQDALKDIIRGTTLLTDDYFKVGDLVKIGDNTGEVTYMGLKSTKLKDIYTNNVVSIANRNIEKVEILSSSLFINVPMPYETKLKDAESAMDDLVKEVLKLKNVKEADYSNVSELADSCIKYRINAKINNKYLLPTNREVNRCIIEVLAKHKISIPYNQLDIHNK